MYTRPANYLVAVALVLAGARAAKGQDPVRLPGMVVKAPIEQPGATTVCSSIRAEAATLQWSPTKTPGAVGRTAVATVPVPGTVLEYAGTLGARGIRPTQRIGIFDAGYVFGRTGWGETRAFTQESTYSIRFGPSQKLHGHNDHTSVTYTSHGRDILIDGGWCSK